MKTTDINILKQFYTVLNRQELTEDIYNKLLKLWNLNGIDLNEEQNKINQKKSKLSFSRRKAVPEFIILKKMLDEKRNAEKTSISMNYASSENLFNDQITF